MTKINNICVMKFDIPNKNGRIYSSDCVDLNDQVICEKIANGVFFGQIGFSNNIDGSIDMTKISHRVTSLYKKDDGLYADIEILDTPFGRELEKEFNENNFRTAGIGNLNNNYVKDYTLLSIDYVEDPA